MFTAEVLKNKIYISNVFRPEDRNSLKALGFRQSPKNASTYLTSYDVYFKVKNLISSPIDESESLIAFRQDLEDKAKKDFSSYFDSCPFKLFPFQKDFVRWFNDPLISRQAAFNASGCGLGKTVQALAAVFATNPEASLIIVCPKNAISVWKNHLDRFGYKLPIKTTYEPFKGACIITYESIPPLRVEGCNVKSLEDFYTEIPKGTFLIADEFHRCKNAKAKRTKRFKKLNKQIGLKKGKCIALTGTPILNRCSEFKTLLENLDLFKSCFGNAETFNLLFGGSYHPRFRFLTFDSSLRKPEEIKSRVKDVLFIRKKEEVFEELSEVFEKTIELDFLNKTSTKSLDELDLKYKDKTDILDDLDRADFNSYNLQRQALSLEKYKNALDTISDYEEIEKPIIVFSDFREPIVELGKRKGWRGITGTTSKNDRDLFTEEFNSGKLKGLAVTIGTGSEARSFTGTDTVLFLDLSVVPGLNHQARKRIDRMDKVNKTLNYVYFVANHPFEKRLTNLILEKEKLCLDVY